MEHSYYLIYKPYGMLSQFTPEAGHRVLGQLGKFPKDVYPVGRLDADSEGLLLMTNDKRLNDKLLNPKNEHVRCYWVQVEGEVTQAALEQLKKGLDIKVKGAIYHTKPAKASRFTPPETLPERTPPVRHRKNIPTSWIDLRLTEGKNRQVRRMTAKVGFPTLRLMRVAIGKIFIGNMQPGDVIRINEDMILRKLGIDLS